MSISRAKGLISSCDFIDRHFLHNCKYEDKNNRNGKLTSSFPLSFATLAVASHPLPLPWSGLDFALSLEHTTVFQPSVNKGSCSSIAYRMTPWYHVWCVAICNRIAATWQGRLPATCYLTVPSDRNSIELLSCAQRVRHTHVAAKNKSIQLAAHCVLCLARWRRCVVLASVCAKL